MLGKLQFRVYLTVGDWKNKVEIGVMKFRVFTYNPTRTIRGSWMEFHYQMQIYPWHYNVIVTWKLSGNWVAEFPNIQFKLVAHHFQCPNRKRGAAKRFGNCVKFRLNYCPVDIEHMIGFECQGRKFISLRTLIGWMTCLFSLSCQPFKITCLTLNLNSNDMPAMTFGVTPLSSSSSAIS